MGDIPETIGRFEIIDIVGKGAMGIVYRARDPNIDRTIAIKTIKTAEIEDAADGEELIQRFRREVQTAGILTHSNIVTIYDVGQKDDLHWIAMEFVDGPSLAKIIEDRVVLPLQDVLAIFVKICSAVDFAHKRGIIHRDLKPANILLTEDWEPKIADFGIARVSSSTMTRTGVILGTPSYMSPEQITGQSIDGRSDIFALGIILYELVTGERPFMGENPTTIMYKIVHSDPLDPNAVNLALPKGLSDIVMKALAKNPQERYQTAGQMANDLVSLVRSSPEFAVATSRLDMPTAAIGSAEISTAFDRYQSVEAPGRAKGRSPLLWIVISIIVLAGVIGGGLYFLSQGGLGGGILSGGGSSVAGGEAPVPTLTKKITVNSEPEGASISVDGEQQVGLTPAAITISKPKGSVVAIVVEKDCLGAEAQITVEDEEPLEQTFVLETQHREISIASTPEGADIRVDGEQLGKTPAQLDIECGKEYQLQLAASGYRSANLTLNWESEPVNATLERLSPGTIALQGSYPVAIYRGRSRLAAGTNSVSLQPGTYNLRLVNSEYFLDMNITIEVREGQRHQAQLPGLGSLWVFANPPDAEIVIDGQNLGQVLPIRDKPIAAGTHEIKFVWQNGEKTQRFEVKAGERSQVREVLEQ